MSYVPKGLANALGVVGLSFLAEGCTLAIPNSEPLPESYLGKLGHALHYINLLGEEDMTVTPMGPIGSDSTVRPERRTRSKTLPIETDDAVLLFSLRGPEDGAWNRLVTVRTPYIGDGTTQLLTDYGPNGRSDTCTLKRPAGARADGEPVSEEVPIDECFSYAGAVDELLLKHAPHMMDPARWLP
jgi:hypothetical protein